MKNKKKIILLVLTYFVNKQIMECDYENDLKSLNSIKLGGWLPKEVQVECCFLLNNVATIAMDNNQDNNSSLSHHFMQVIFLLFKEKIITLLCS